MSDENAEAGAEAPNDADVVAELAGNQNNGAGDASTERPEHVQEKFWDAEKGEIRVDDALKSYSELEKKFGSFTGAPEDYELSISDELKEQGVELDAESGMLTDITVLAKDLGLNQDGFDKVLNVIGINALAEQKADADFKAEQIAALGDGADRRIENLKQWASRNMDEENYDGFSELTQSAQAIKALERIVAMTRSAPAQPTEANAGPSIDATKLREMKFAKDESGQRKYDTDPAWRKQVQDGYKGLYGEEPAKDIIR